MSHSGRSDAAEEIDIFVPTLPPTFCAENTDANSANYCVAKTARKKPFSPRNGRLRLCVRVRAKSTVPTVSPDAGCAPPTLRLLFLIPFAYALMLILVSPLRLA